MSGLKPTEMFDFYRSLHARGMTTDLLAEELDVSPGVVRRLISNLRPRRGPTWKALLGVLTERERQLLLTVEQCPTWNARQLGKRPRWTPEKAAILAAREVAAG